MQSRIAAAILAPTAADPRALRELALRTCLTSVERVAVILAEASARALAPALHGLPLRIEPARDTASALRVALPWALRSGCDGLLLLAADAPRVAAADLEHLLAAFRAGNTPALIGPLEMPAVVHRADFGRLVAHPERLVVAPLAAAA